MLKRLWIVGTLLLAAHPGFAKKGESPRPAPDFALQDHTGKAHKLSDFKGKWVVLEWWNQDCPYVKRHYDTGSMQKLQGETVADGGIWLTVLSSAAGEDGYLAQPAEFQKAIADQNMRMTAILRDPEGVMGKAYGAKTTPHMFVINPSGQIVYEGAIDDKVARKNEDVTDPSRKNYVRLALAAGKSGQAISPSVTTPYGCSVKYKKSEAAKKAG